MKKETEEKIIRDVEEVIERDLVELKRISVELELDGKRYIVIPHNTDFSGFITKAIELTIKKCSKK